MSTTSILNKKLDVVHLRSEDDLVLETHNQIKLSTSNLLINYIPFDEYVRKVVFDTSITSTNIRATIHNGWSGSVNGDRTKINLTANASEVIVDEVHTSGIFATESHINNKVHFVNLSARNQITMCNLSDPSNIIYTDGSSEYSLSNYIYKLVNSPISHTTETLSPNNVSNSGLNIDTSGTYVGNMITTNKLTTANVMISGSEPVLEINSATAINFELDVFGPDDYVNIGSNLLFGNLSLDNLVKSQLDETGQLELEAVMSSGQDIGMTLNTLTHKKRFEFTYDVEFLLYEHNDDFDTMIANGIKSTLRRRITIPESLPLDLGSFTGLDAGKFYTVLGKFTNTRTGTTVSSIQVSGGQNVATIQNVVITSIVVKDEETITISFVPHNTYVASWTDSSKQVQFSIGIDGYTGDVYTSRIQNLGTDPPNQTPITYDLRLANLPSYGNGGILRVNESKETEEHVINVISRHAGGGTFQMLQSGYLTSFTFSAPTNAPSLSIDYYNRRLTWSHTNSTASSRLKTIYLMCTKTIL